MPVRNYYRKPVNPWPRRLLMLLLAVVLGYSVWRLGSYFDQQRRELALRRELTGLLGAEAGQTMDETGNLEQTAAMPEETRPTAETPDGDAAAAPLPSPAAVRSEITPSAAPPAILMYYQAAWERNNDLVGWLNVRALPQVNLPVVQRDHSYYLRRDFDGSSNNNGTVFMDVSCSIWPRSDNLIVYGHNMKSGEMFGSLQKLMFEPFYRENPLASFNTIYERAEYVPLAVLVCAVAEGPEYFAFHTADFADQAEFERFIARARELSTVHPPYDAAYGDQLLTLVTCYDEANTKRLLVILRRIRENEDPAELAVMWR